MTTKLTLYNGALMLCKEKFLAALTDNVESRRLLDQAWDTGAINYCLEQGQWFFAMRTQRIDYDPGITPDFGYQRAFDKPTDWVLTSALCSDEYFRTPLLRLTDEAGYWYAEVDTIYVKYVSNSSTYGNDMNKWPDSFRELVEGYLATRIIGKLAGTNAELIKEIETKYKQRLLIAKSKAAMAEPTHFPAQGTWSRARTRWLGRRDGGNTQGGLIG